MEENPTRFVSIPHRSLVTSTLDMEEGVNRQPPFIARPSTGHVHPMINLLPRAHPTLQLSFANKPHWLELKVVTHCHILCI